MSDSLLDEIVSDAVSDQIDPETIIDRFVEVGTEYSQKSNESTAAQIAVLVEHFDGFDPDTADDETVAVLWTLCTMQQGILSDTPKFETEFEWCETDTDPSGEDDGSEDELIERGGLDNTPPSTVIKNIITNIISERGGNVAPKQEVVSRATDDGLSENRVLNVLNQLKTRGEIYEPKSGHVSVV